MPKDDDQKTIQKLKSKIQIMQDQIKTMQEEHEAEIRAQISSKKKELQKMQDQIQKIKKEHEEEIKRIQKEQNKNQIDIHASLSQESSNKIQILESEEMENMERIEIIGRGSGGDVFKVAMKTFYALKIMCPTQVNHESFRSLLNEYEIMNLMNHPNILKTFGIFLSDAKTPPSILLEFCPKNLEFAIKEKSMNKCDIVFTIYQIVEGMKYVHYQKIIHRDLKPTNILIASDGTIKICDFGISKLMTAEEQSMTKGLGTQKYMHHSIIQSNYSKGGAISMKSYSNLSLFECIFKNNKIISEQEDSYGGAISLYNSIISCKKSLFVNNLAYSKSSQSSIRSVGGAISFFYRMNDNEILNESFIECSFINNTAYSDDCLSYGGAILYCKSHKFEKNISFTSNELFQNLTFINNTAYSEECSTFGGAIVYEVSILYPHQNVVQNRVFEYLNFVGNTAFSKSSQTEGGAICFLFFYTNSCISKQNGTINKSTFTNNTASSTYSNSFGGAIMINFVSSIVSNTTEFAENNVFNNNKVYSYSSYGYGGSVYLYNSKGKFQNCTFSGNIATQYGAGVFLMNSDYSVLECTFQNNTVNGEKNEKGGAIFSSESTLYLNKSSFINNILCPENKYATVYYLEGAACHFDGSKVHVSDCDFVNNTIKIMKHYYYADNICGGAIYSEMSRDAFNCTNCSFINNTIHCPNNKNKEFGGAINLNNGKINNCTFINNMAYNGCDIKYKQSTRFNLCITGCIFEHNNIENRYGIMSLIYLYVIYNRSFSNEFSNNRISNNILLNLFDGEFKLEPKKIKFNFKDNCICPFNSSSFTNEKFMITNETDEIISFDSAFSPVCGENAVSKTPLPTSDNQQVISDDIQKENKKNQKIFIILICIMIFHIIFVLILVVWLVLKEIRKRNKDNIIDPLLDIDIPSFLI